MKSVIIFMWIALIFGVLTFSKRESSSKKEEKTIDVFAWSEAFFPETIEAFTNETGINVRMHYYTSNEELLTKLRACKGKGYDLIIPSDYTVKILIDEEMLKPLDKSQLEFASHLNPVLLGRDYDPDNTYSLPYEWEIFGFGIDVDAFDSPPTSWKELFSPSMEETKIAMTNDPIEAVNFAAYHLFGEDPTISDEGVYRISHLLKTQKKWVESYAGLRADYLLATKNCQIALSTGSFIFRSLDHSPHVKFVLPDDYTFISIENVCIPKYSEKEALTYLFLNKVYAPKAISKYCSTFYTFPATTNCYPLIEAPPYYMEILQDPEFHKRRLYFIRHLISEKEARTLWINVKS
ncbi:extracellular solute-binding protein [Candidatus Neptunochlamydia vexilliferae]|uniref:Spermidine/putrescine-binding periplasmic protein n=1 Tax=Candidatus Neptunichlamydia vexilliferae TaxID=1651774 RepID=A0ABS0AZQ8_9BACT|nr:extracellular solute-binding protein [Candidatus Neptunochlamydia vexilliferae]MBF5059611.1 hypothetical protein [Candidatus Neptunochlamydia vexilliferae]